MDVLVLCRLSEPNPRDFVNMLASAEDFSVTALTEDVGDTSGIRNDVTIEVLELQSIPPISFLDPRDSKRYRSIVQVHNPDVILIMGVTDLVFLPLYDTGTPAILVPQGGELSRATNTPHWTSSRLKKFYYGIVYRRLFSQLLDRVDEVWGVNETNRETFRALGCDDQTFVPFDWVSVDAQQFTPDVSAVQYGPTDSVTIGSFRRIRGDSLAESYRAVLNAIPHLQSSDVNFHLVFGGIYGDARGSDIVAEIDEFIEARSIEDQVTKIGMIDKSEMPRHYAGIDIYINFMWKDLALNAIGKGAKEAMATGCAPMLFHDPAQGYRVDNEIPGAKVTMDPVNIANELTRLCENTRYREKIEQEARSYIERTASRDAIMREIVRRCERVLGQR